MCIRLCLQQRVQAAGRVLAMFEAVPELAACTLTLVDAVTLTWTTML